ncbi:hypothetical protein P153DRAFT_103703 [Dothidotthia symphoricarpi CBS 119687]|uniref:HMG box domain-containing protein n=1 Tax=Dothidotthia symphoricarpi CBS 119687 TaxID=1392245 RepID=A0A6A6AU12_9PLEO|nr:uncharacterized protein P153DRAFT_103703 [Dothidotthia symphoricarpi CBS 119687]KAF2134041.1 hypothetical protein P153DRAFT_103703 [Dothidotthia symphoricarpi CBS 119687]
MNDLKDRLQQLGLSQYFEDLVAEGFDTWATVLDITESDLSHLNIKLGHRRKLQRGIAESRGQSAHRPLPTTLNRVTSAEGSYRSDDDSAENVVKRAESSTVGTTGTSTKRKYRRHPKPDEHAPERPPSAYVIFSNQVRESLKGQDLSFTEIAKVVGEKWQILPVEERESCERQANSAKEKYYAGLAEYKKTSQFAIYQQYLEDFKAKHAGPTKGASPCGLTTVSRSTLVTDIKGKRSKLQTERSTSVRNNSYEQGERALDRRLSSTQPEYFTTGHHRLQPSPPTPGVPSLSKAPSSFSKPSSPIPHSISGFNSPRMDQHYSPAATSPRAMTTQQESVFEVASVHIARDSRARQDVNMPYHSSLYTQPMHQLPPTTSPPHTHALHYQSPVEVTSHSRRQMLESTRLPPLTHEDSTWSSESGHSGYNLPSAGFSGQLPLVDPVKSLRTLPQPMPNMVPVISPLDRLPLATSPPLQHQSRDYRAQGSLAVLIRAGELAARAADEEAMEKNPTP